MSLILKWNTGCQYTRHGQRIQAEIGPDYVIFHDFDRMIYGRLQSSIPDSWPHMSEHQRMRWVHQEYLHMRYSWASEPGIWDPDGEFPLIRM